MAVRPVLARERRLGIRSTASIPLYCAGSVRRGTAQPFAEFLPVVIPAAGEFPQLAIFKSFLPIRSKRTETGVIKLPVLFGMPVFIVRSRD